MDTAWSRSAWKGSTLPGASATFIWTAAQGATGYKLWVGSTPGGHDIDIATGSYPDGQQTRVSNLPTNGEVLYVTLYAFVNGAWVVQDTAVYLAATV